MIVDLAGEITASYRHKLESLGIIVIFLFLLEMRQICVSFFCSFPGIFEESFVKFILDSKFIATLVNDSKESILWEKKYGKSVNESLREFVLEYIGKPIDGLFT